MAESDCLNHIAELAHNGGLADLSEGDALTAIRRLTLPYWSRTSGSEGTAKVLHAIAASNSPTREGDYDG